MSWLSDILKDYPALDVAKQRLALMQEKYDTAVAMNKALTDRISTLEIENTELRTELEHYEERRAGSLDGDARRVLEAVYHLGGENITIAAVSQRLQMDLAKTKLILRKLDEQNYLFDRLYTNRPAEYCLHDRGTEFLMSAGVIK